MKFAGVLLVALLTACGGGGGGGEVVAQPVVVAAPAPAPVPAAAPAPAPAPAPVTVTVTVPAAQPEPVAQPLQVYLFMGQSNMSGWISKTSELPPELQAAQPAVAWTGSAWVQLKPFAGYQQDGQFGPEISFAFRKGAIGVVKFSKGSTGLAKDWMPPGALLDQAIAWAKQAQASQPIKFAGVLWDQGGTDMNRLDWSNAYAENLRTMVAKLRTELGAPDLRFVAVREYTRQDLIPDQFPGRAIVRAAIENPGIENYGWINADDLVPLGDLAHYTTPNIVKIGERLADTAP